MNTQPTIKPEIKVDNLPGELKSWLKDAEPAQLFRINLKRVTARCVISPSAIPSTAT
jgi:hypothetical protein